MTGPAFTLRTLNLDLPGVAAAFGRRLHDAGVDTTADRAVRFARALELGRPVSRVRLYWIARSVFLTDRAQLRAFDSVFAEVFGAGGRPAEIEQLRAQAAALALDGALIWAGQIAQAEVAAYLHAADALVIPDTITDVTASPLKLFEYMAAGRAVVLPNIPALAEVLPLASGYYFRRGDRDTLAQALITALTDPDRAEREQAARAAATQHTYAARAERILALAEAVAQRYGTIG